MDGLAALPLVLARFAREFRGFAARAPLAQQNRHATQAMDGQNWRRLKWIAKPFEHYSALQFF